MPRRQGSVCPLWLEGKNQAHFDLSPGLGAGATGVRVAALTWLVEKAPEFILHISLALLQVLLLEDIDELRLPPYQQMLLVNKLEPVHQHVILTTLCKSDAH